MRDIPTGVPFHGYAIEGLLGSGGMGRVYRARDASGRPVALKVVTIADPTARERFLREARIGMTLDHPGIVKVLDVGFERDLPFLVMQLIEGETLAQALRRGVDPAASARLLV